MIKLIVRLLLYLLAAGCVWYSVVVASVRSGSKFFMVWDMIALVLVLIALGVKFGVWVHLHKGLKIGIVSVCAVGLVTFIVLLSMIMGAYRESETKQVDYLIVLGAQMRSDGPSVVLQFRLDRAAEYLKEYPEAMCIVSGGQGANEPCSEAEGMARYLIDRGISKDRIIKEDKSTNTRENFIYSIPMIPEGARVGVLTNNFHMKRALYLAGKYEIEDPVAVVAESTTLYAPNNVLREVLGLLKDIVVR